ncbi:MAG: DUF128 domain-containing protein [Sedimentisphaerales bacterium]|nr:DUF128 domain-containing protein [Sedimentisphaerales bacterium]
MSIDHQRKMVAILKILDQAGKPLGSTALSRDLSDMGFELRERMIRNYLHQMDLKGLTKNLGRRGRIITDEGHKELDVAVAIDKVGFINSRINELAYRMTFDEDRLSGTVIVNVSTVTTPYAKKSLREVARVMDARLGMGRFFLTGGVLKEDQEITPHIADGQMTIGTICSVTLNGIFLRHHINMISRFGGLLEFQDHQPVRFSQIISYDGSTIDPIEIFIKGKMTSVHQVMQNGTGSIGVGFREIPAVALDDANRIIEKLEKLGLGGVIMIGRPNRPLLDIPVSVGQVGMIVTAGLNPVAALEEMGMYTTNRALYNLCDFKRLQSIQTILNP